MRVAIVGTRDSNMFHLSEIIRRIPAQTSLIISGGAIGVDTLAEQAAEQLGIGFSEILPDYKKYGRHAPLIRNQDIVDSADLVLAFWDYRSRGTAFVLAYCIEKQVPVQVYGAEEGGGQGEKEPSKGETAKIRGKR